MEIKLKKVTNKDLEFLYDLLLTRKPNVNISHKKIPTFIQHKRFVNSKPYLFWYIIIQDNEKIGSIYLSKMSEIGIFLKHEYQNSGAGKLAVITLMKKHPQERFLANVNPKNIKSKKFFKKLGFKLIQHTYELSKG